MINSNRQTLERGNSGFVRIVMTFIVSIALMNVAMSLSSNLGGALSTIVGLSILAVGGIICTKMIYNNLTNFQYKIIADELIFERSIGRGNHVIINTRFKDVLSFEACGETYDYKDLKGIRKFVISKDISDWYLLEFKKDDQRKKLIIEPNEEFLKTILGRLDYE